LTHRAAVCHRQTGVWQEAEPPFTPFQLPGSDPFVVLHPSNASFRRRCLAAVGGLGETGDPARDVADICRRLVDQGVRLTPLDGAVVYLSACPTGGGESDVCRVQGNTLSSGPTTFRPFPTLSRPDPHLTVCFVSREYPPQNPWGPARYTADLARGLADEGHEVHVVAEAAGPGARLEEGVWVHRVPAQTEGGWDRPSLGPVERDLLGWAAAAHAAVKRLAAGRAVDLVSVPARHGEGLFCVLDDDLKTVLTLNTTTALLDRTRPPGSGPNSPEQLVVGHAPFLAAMSPAVLDRARKDFGEPAAAHVLPPGIPRRATDVPPRGLAGPVRVLAAGGTAAFLAAAAELGTEFPDAEFVVLGGPLSEGQFATELARCDVFVHPDRDDGLAPAVLDAMALGKPVVAAGIGAVTGLVADGETGYLAYPDSGGSLAAQLRPLLASAGLRARFGAAGRRRYETAFRRESAVREVVRVYTELAGAFAA